MQTLPSSLIIPVPVDGGVVPVVGGLKEGIGIICFSINALNPLLAITRAEVALPNASRQFSVEIIFLASSRLVLASAKWSLEIFRRSKASPGNLFKIVGEKTFVLSDSFRLLILFSNFSIKASFVL